MAIGRVSVGAPLGDPTHLSTQGGTGETRGLIMNKKRKDHKVGESQGAGTLGERQGLQLERVVLDRCDHNIPYKCMTFTRER